MGGKIKNKEVLVRLGKQIRAERLKKDYSQETLGFKAGVHRNYVGLLEKGSQNVTITTAHRIAKALKMKLKDLIDF